MVRLPDGRLVPAAAPGQQQPPKPTQRLVFQTGLIPVRCQNGASGCAQLLCYASPGATVSIVCFRCNSLNVLYVAGDGAGTAAQD